jgi:hypothetical protein
VTDEKEALVQSAQDMGKSREVPISDELAGMFGKLEKLSWYEDEDCLLGTVYVLGVPHFVTFVRVTYDEASCTVATRDPNNRLDDILAGCYDGPPMTVRLPGFEGDWIVGVDPYRD